MPTHSVVRNLTLSVEEKVVERARAAARARGKSLNALIREYIEALAGRASGKELADDILSLFEEEPGDSRGKRVRRAHAYEGRL